MPDGAQITLNGTIYVPLEQLHAAIEERDQWRRTLAIAHMYLLLHDDPDAALQVIARDTGAGLVEASRVAEVIGILGRHGGGV